MRAAKISRRSILALGSLSVLPWVQRVAAQDSGQPRTGGILRVILNSEPSSVFAPIEPGGSPMIVGSKLFETLLRVRHDGSFEGMLAESWSMAPDGREYRFRLRDNVRFHDKRPLTSEDVAFSMMQLWKKENTFGRVAFADVTAAETPDAVSVVFKLGQPMPPYPFLGMLAAFGSVAPQHVYGSGEIRRHPRINNPVGSGPFRFKEWSRGNYIILERNPDYREARKPFLDQVVFRIVPDAGARAAAFEAEEADVGTYGPVGVADLRRLSKLPYIVTDGTGNNGTVGTYAMEVNLRRKELADARVRQAINVAIDRGFICRTIFEGAARPARGPIRSSNSLFDPTLAEIAFDIERANKLLDEAGYAKGANGRRFNVNIDPNPFSPVLGVIADYLRQALAAIGIGATIRKSDGVTYNQRIYNDYNFDLTIQVFSTLVDPQISNLNYFWSKGISKGRFQTNATDYRSDEMDQIIEGARTEVDPEKRRAAMGQFQRIAMRDLPLIPLVEYDSYNVFNKRVQAHSNGPMWPLQSWSDVWLVK